MDRFIQAVDLDHPYLGKMSYAYIKCGEGAAAWGELDTRECVEEGIANWERMLESIAQGEQHPRVVEREPIYRAELEERRRAQRVLAEREPRVRDIPFVETHDRKGDIYALEGFREIAIDGRPAPQVFVLLRQNVERDNLVVHRVLDLDCVRMFQKSMWDDAKYYEDQRGDAPFTRKQYVDAALMLKEVLETGEKRQAELDASVVVALPKNAAKPVKPPGFG